jgi:hypothetical protein
MKEFLHGHHMGAGTPTFKERAGAAPVTVLQYNVVVAVSATEMGFNFAKGDPFWFLGIPAGLVNFANQV